MRLDFDAFKIIKPDGALDDYEAGQSAQGEFKMCTVEKGKLYRVMIKKVISNRGAIPSTLIADELGLCKKSVSSILQKLVRDGVLKKGEKVSGAARKKAFTYMINEA
jgi:predicted transcriptional regulator